MTELKIDREKEGFAELGHDFGQYLRQWASEAPEDQRERRKELLSICGSSLLDLVTATLMAIRAVDGGDPMADFTRIVDFNQRERQAQRNMRN